MKYLKKKNGWGGLLLIVSGLIFLSGCGSTQKSEFYQLNQPINSSLKGTEKGYIIGVGPIHLAEYLNRPQIITRHSIHQLNVSEFHRWVEPLNESITRLLVINFSNNLNTNRVYWIPRQDRQYPLDIRIVIDIGRFEGELGGDVVLESRWSIFSKSNQPVLTRVSLIKEKVQGQNYESLVKAMTQALQTLGQEISQASAPYLK